MAPTATHLPKQATTTPRRVDICGSWVPASLTAITVSCDCGSRVPASLTASGACGLPGFPLPVTALKKSPPPWPIKNFSDTLLNAAPSGVLTWPYTCRLPMSGGVEMQGGRGPEPHKPSDTRSSSLCDEMNPVHPNRQCAPAPSPRSAEVETTSPCGRGQKGPQPRVMARTLRYKNPCRCSCTLVMG